jgi:hypothetical protein
MVCTRIASAIERRGMRVRNEQRRFVLAHLPAPRIVQDGKDRHRVGIDPKPEGLEQLDDLSVITASFTEEHGT